MPRGQGHGTKKARRQYHSLSTRTNYSLCDTILSGKDTCRPTRFSDLSLVQCNISHPVRRLRQNYSTHKRQQFRPTSPCPHHSLHDTIPLGRDTCRPARPLGWNKARSNNSCSVRRPRQCCSTHKAGRKFLQCPYYKVYDTILSGMDTGTAAQSSDLSVGRRHNGQTGTGPETCSTSATMASQHKN